MSAVDGGVIEAPPRRAARAPPGAHPRRSSIELLAWHEPAAVALEDVYFGKNVRSAIAVGQARGVALLAAGQRDVPCFDYTPAGGEDGGLRQRRGGQAAGPAHGRHPARPRRSPPQSDHAADALAVAICHAGHARPAHALARRRAAEVPVG